MAGPFIPCDTCRARSYLFAMLPSGGDLSYCAHHGTKYWMKLSAEAFHIDDRRAQSRCGCDHCPKDPT